MKSPRDRITEEHARAARSGKASGLPTTLPSVPTPIQNDNKEWARAFEIRRHSGGNPFSFNEDTHH
jgi:hypothetical protein